MGRRFYFDLHNGDGEQRDDVGLELGSTEQVAREVARILTDIARDEFVQNERRGIATVKVREADGTPFSMGTISFTYEATLTTA